MKLGDTINTYNEGHAALALSVVDTALAKKQSSLPSAVNSDSSPVKVLSPKVPEKEEEDCPICLDSLTELAGRSEKVVKTKCGHIFCEKDIHAHVSKNDECPLCRATVIKEELQPVDVAARKVAKQKLASSAPVEREIEAPIEEPSVESKRDEEPPAPCSPCRRIHAPPILDLGVS